MYELGQKHGLLLLEELILEAGYDTSTKCTYDRPDGGLPILRIPNVASEEINLDDLKFAVLSDKERRKVRLAPDDLLIVRTNGSADLVGRCAVVPTLPEPAGFASYLIRIKADQARIDPNFLQLVLRFLRNDGQLFDFARTTAGQYNVSLGRLKAACIPVPPLAEQRRIVAHFDSLQTKMAPLRALHSKIADELDALLPSILDRAFKGEL